MSTRPDNAAIHTGVQSTDLEEQDVSVSDTSPRVSVVIPAYNTAKFIGATLNSVLAQTFSNYEILIINDGSPDTPQLERALGPFRDRITYIRQENGGPARARNRAIAQAKGRYIAFLDSDDMWMPDYLAKQVKILDLDPSVTLVCADACLFGDSVLAGKTFFGLWPSSEPVTFEKLLTWKCAVLTMCVVARRRSLLEAGLFDEEFLRSEDYHLWLRLAHRGERFAYQHQVLGQHRMHSESLAADAKRLYESQIAVYQKLSKTLALSTEEQALINQQITRTNADLALQHGKSQILAGEYDDAVKALGIANDYYKSLKLSLVLFGLRLAPKLVRYIYDMRRRYPGHDFSAAIRMLQF